MKDRFFGEKVEEQLENYIKIVGYDDSDSSYSIGYFEDKFAIYYWIDGEGESLEVYCSFEEAKNDFDASNFFNQDFETFKEDVKELNERVKSFEIK